MPASVHSDDQPMPDASQPEDHPQHLLLDELREQEKDKISIVGYFLYSLLLAILYLSIVLLVICVLDVKSVLSLALSGHSSEEVGWKAVFVSPTFRLYFTKPSSNVSK